MEVHVKENGSIGMKGRALEHPSWQLVAHTSFGGFLVGLVFERRRTRTWRFRQSLRFLALSLLAAVAVSMPGFWATASMMATRRKVPQGENERFAHIWWAAVD